MPDIIPFICPSCDNVLQIYIGLERHGEPIRKYYCVFLQGELVPNYAENLYIKECSKFTIKKEKC